MSGSQQKEQQKPLQFAVVVDEVTRHNDEFQELRGKLGPMQLEIAMNREKKTGKEPSAETVAEIKRCQARVRELHELMNAADKRLSEVQTRMNTKGDLKDASGVLICKGCMEPKPGKDELYPKEGICRPCAYVLLSMQHDAKTNQKHCGRCATSRFPIAPVYRLCSDCLVETGVDYDEARARIRQVRGETKAAAEAAKDPGQEKVEEKKMEKKEETKLSAAELFKAKLTEGYVGHKEIVIKVGSTAMKVHCWTCHKVIAFDHLQTHAECGEHDDTLGAEQGATKTPPPSPAELPVGAAAGAGAGAGAGPGSGAGSSGAQSEALRRLEAAASKLGPDEILRLAEQLEAGRSPGDVVKTARSGKGTKRAGSAKSSGRGKKRAKTT